MKSWILYRVNGQREELVDWNQINWSKVYKVIKSLRKRIFRARKLGQWKQLRRLQKLMMKSYANLLLAVRQITQVNKGKSTSGIDNQVIDTPEDRLKICSTMAGRKSISYKESLHSKSQRQETSIRYPNHKRQSASNNS